MKKKKILKWVLIVGISGLVIGGSIIYYMFNMPHRDVQATAVDINLNANDLINEFLTNADEAYNKYLQEEGESKILAVSGTVHDKSKDMNNQWVVVLKDKEDGAGVSCTFLETTNQNAENLKKGDKVTIKGVIRSGASYDEDLEMYEDVIMEKCDVLNKY